MWTHFWDMNSGGDRKEQYKHIFIEAPREEAIRVFYAKFWHNPQRVTCTCCGPDYSITESESLEQLTGYHRGCKFIRSGRDENGKFLEPGGGHYIEEPNEDQIVPGSRIFPSSFMTQEEYEQQPEVKVIRSEEITDEERQTDVPDQGYVWVN